jgi:hypothetical protein
VSSVTDWRRPGLTRMTLPQPFALRIDRRLALPEVPLVRIRVVRRFYGLGRLLEAGEVVALAAPDAAGAVAIGRAVRV